MGLDKPQTKTIAGHAWVVTPFPGRPSIMYEARLVRMFGPSITELAPSFMALVNQLGPEKIRDIQGGGEFNILDVDLDLSFVPHIARSLAKDVNEKELVDTMVELMAMCTRDGMPVTPDLFDTIFAGNDKELYPALWFIVQVNWPDFIEGVASLCGLHPKGSEPETQEKPQPSSATSKK